MLKYYVVVECSGDYEDYRELVIGICPTISLAKSLKKKVKDLLSYKGKIPMSKLDELRDEYWSADNNDDDEAYVIHKLHPEYTLEEIEDALEYYYSAENDKEIIIREINFYENENDLNNVKQKY